MTSLTNYLERFFTVFFLLSATTLTGSPSLFHGEGLPLLWWGEDPEINFGDYLSLVIVERILDKHVEYLVKPPKFPRRKMIALGSLLFYAREHDVIWGCGVHGKTSNPKEYKFKSLDVRAVRGPLTRDFLMNNFNISCPEIYGDPALLIPYLFPEFKRSKIPKYPFIIIPQYNERHLYKNSKLPFIVMPTEPWNVVLEKILDSAFVISASLHGLVLADAFGVPNRMLKTDKEYLLKYNDYYLSTGRPDYQYATSIEEALLMGPEAPLPKIDLKKFYDAFPFDLWPSVTKKILNFDL
jgi:pyruvyltransferase